MDAPCQELIQLLATAGAVLVGGGRGVVIGGVADPATIAVATARLTEVAADDFVVFGTATADGDGLLVDGDTAIGLPEIETLVRGLLGATPTTGAVVLADPGIAGLAPVLGERLRRAVVAYDAGSYTPAGSAQQNLPTLDRQLPGGARLTRTDRGYVLHGGGAQLPAPVPASFDADLMLGPDLPAELNATAVLQVVDDLAALGWNGRLAVVERDPAAASLLHSLVYDSGRRNDLIVARPVRTDRGWQPFARQVLIEAAPASVNAAAGEYYQPRVTVVATTPATEWQTPDSVLTPNSDDPNRFDIATRPGWHVEITQSGLLLTHADDTDLGALGDTARLVAPRSDAPIVQLTPAALAHDDRADVVNDVLRSLHTTVIGPRVQAIEVDRELSAQLAEMFPGTEPIIPAGRRQSSSGALEATVTANTVVVGRRGLTSPAPPTGTSFPTSDLTVFIDFPAWYFETLEPADRAATLADLHELLVGVLHDVGANTETATYFSASRQVADLDTVLLDLGLAAPLELPDFAPDVDSTLEPIVLDYVRATRRARLFPSADTARAATDTYVDLRNALHWLAVVAGDEAAAAVEQQARPRDPAAATEPVPLSGGLRAIRLGNQIVVHGDDEEAVATGYRPPGAGPNTLVIVFTALAGAEPAANRALGEIIAAMPPAPRHALIVHHLDPMARFGTRGIDLAVVRERHPDVALRSTYEPWTRDVGVGEARIVVPAITSDPATISVQDAAVEIARLATLLDHAPYAELETRHDTSNTTYRRSTRQPVELRVPDVDAIPSHYVADGSADPVPMHIDANLERAARARGVVRGGADAGRQADAENDFVILLSQRSAWLSQWQTGAGTIQRLTAAFSTDIESGARDYLLELHWTELTQTVLAAERALLRAQDALTAAQAADPRGAAPEPLSRAANAYIALRRSFAELHEFTAQADADVAERDAASGLRAPRPRPGLPQLQLAWQLYAATTEPRLGIQVTRATPSARRQPQAYTADWQLRDDANTTDVAIERGVDVLASRGRPAGSGNDQTALAGWLELNSLNDNPALTHLQASITADFGDQADLLAQWQTLGKQIADADHDSTVPRWKAAFDTFMGLVRQAGGLSTLLNYVPDPVAHFLGGQLARRAETLNAREAVSAPPMAMMAETQVTPAAFGSRATEAVDRGRRLSQWAERAATVPALESLARRDPDIHAAWADVLGELRAGLRATEQASGSTGPARVVDAMDAYDQWRAAHGERLRRLGVAAPPVPSLVTAGWLQTLRRDVGSALAEWKTLANRDDARSLEFLEVVEQLHSFGGALDQVWAGTVHAVNDAHPELPTVAQRWTALRQLVAGLDDADFAEIATVFPDLFTAMNADGTRQPAGEQPRTRAGLAAVELHERAQRIHSWLTSSDGVGSRPDSGPLAERFDRTTTQLANALRRAATRPAGSDIHPLDEADVRAELQDAVDYYGRLRERSINQTLPPLPAVTDTDAGWLAAMVDQLRRHDEVVSVMLRTAGNDPTLAEFAGQLAQLRAAVYGTWDAEAVRVGSDRRAFADLVASWRAAHRAAQRVPRLHRDALTQLLPDVDADTGLIRRTSNADPLVYTSRGPQRLAPHRITHPDDVGDGRREAAREQNTTVVDEVVDDAAPAPRSPITSAVGAVARYVSPTAGMLRFDDARFLSTLRGAGTGGQRGGGLPAQLMDDLTTLRDLLQRQPGRGADENTRRAYIAARERLTPVLDDLTERVSALETDPTVSATTQVVYGALAAGAFGIAAVHAGEENRLRSTDEERPDLALYALLGGGTVQYVPHLLSQLFVDPVASAEQVRGLYRGTFAPFGIIAGAFLFGSANDLTEEEIENAGTFQQRIARGLASERWFRTVATVTTFAYVLPTLNVPDHVAEYQATRRPDWQLPRTSPDPDRLLLTGDDLAHLVDRISFNVGLLAEMAASFNERGGRFGTNLADHFEVIRDTARRLQTHARPFRPSDPTTAGTESEEAALSTLDVTTKAIHLIEVLGIALGNAYLSRNLGNFDHAKSISEAATAISTQVQLALDSRVTVEQSADGVRDVASDQISSLILNIANTVLSTGGAEAWADGETAPAMLAGRILLDLLGNLFLAQVIADGPDYLVGTAVPAVATAGANAAATSRDYLVNLFRTVVNRAARALTTTAEPDQGRPLTTLAPLTPLPAITPLPPLTLDATAAAAPPAVQPQHDTTNSDPDPLGVASLERALPGARDVERQPGDASDDASGRGSLTVDPDSTRHVGMALVRDPFDQLAEIFQNQPNPFAAFTDPPIAATTVAPGNDDLWSAPFADGLRPIQRQRALLELVRSPALVRDASADTVRELTSALRQQAATDPSFAFDSQMMQWFVGAVHGRVDDGDTSEHLGAVWTMRASDAPPDAASSFRRAMWLDALRVAVDNGDLSEPIRRTAVRTLIDCP